MAGLDDTDVADAVRIELLNRLIDKGERGDSEDGAPTVIQFIFGDRRGDDGFAETGGACTMMRRDPD